MSNPFRDETATRTVEIPRTIQAQREVFVAYDEASRIVGCGATEEEARYNANTGGNPFALPSLTGLTRVLTVLRYRLGE
ncbi:MAG: hypothetical protein HOW73_47680 [Polyangiaceae bacterium]|nr:hypothetical protein [Polyangiaceae bacterium]